MAMAYDAGTDAGATFVTPDVMEDPFQPISMIACGEFDAFCETATPATSSPSRPSRSRRCRLVTSIPPSAAETPIPVNGSYT